MERTSPGQEQHKRNVEEALMYFSYFIEMTIEEKKELRTVLEDKFYGQEIKIGSQSFSAEDLCAYLQRHHNIERGQKMPFDRLRKLLTYGPVDRPMGGTPQGSSNDRGLDEHSPHIKLGDVGGNLGGGGNWSQS